MINMLAYVIVSEIKLKSFLNILSDSVCRSLSESGLWMEAGMSVAVCEFTVREVNSKL